MQGRVMSTGHFLPRTWLALAVVLMTCLSACSSEDSRVYDAFKCGKAATMLGHRTQAGAAARYADQHFSQVSGSKAQYAAMLGQKFNDDYDLDQMDAQEQLALMSKLYASSLCTGIYQ